MNLNGTVDFFKSVQLEPAYPLALYIGILEFFGGMITETVILILPDMRRKNSIFLYIIDEKQLGLRVNEPACVLGLLQNKKLQLWTEIPERRPQYHNNLILH